MCLMNEGLFDEVRNAVKPLFLGKAVEIILVLKKSEHQLKAEQADLLVVLLWWKSGNGR